MQLDELQRSMRATVVCGEPLPLEVAQALVGGALPVRRLSLHHRHYVASLVAALHGRFPAVSWLIGEEAMLDAALAFVQVAPPDTPCIAEFGARFPAHLEAVVGVQHPCVGDLSRVEWHVGRAAVSIDQPLTVEDLLAFADVEAPLTAFTSRLPSALAMVEVAWPVDDLMRRFLAGEAPPPVVPRAPRTLVITGARGEFRLDRASDAQRTLLRGLATGRSLGDALSDATVGVYGEHATPHDVAVDDPARGSDHDATSLLLAAVQHRWLGALERCSPSPAPSVE